MNQILVGKVLHHCGDCGQFRTTDDCLICDAKHNQFVLALRVSAHSGSFVQVICG